MPRHFLRKSHPKGTFTIWVRFFASTTCKVRGGFASPIFPIIFFALAVRDLYGIARLQQ